MLVLRQKFYSKKNKWNKRFGNGYSEDDLEDASTIPAYLPAVLAAPMLTGHGAITGSIGTHVGNSKLEKALRKGEDFDDARSEGMKKAALVGGLSGAGTSLIAGNLADSVMGSAAVKNGAMKKEEVEMCRSLIKAGMPAYVAMSALSIGGAAALGTYIKANSIKKQKDKRDRRK
jgi:hypothetical protein